MLLDELDDRISLAKQVSSEDSVTDLKQKLEQAGKAGDSGAEKSQADAMVVSLAVIARRLAKASEILHSSDTADYKANREDQEMVLDFGLERSQRGGFGNRIGSDT